MKFFGIDVKENSKGYFGVRYCQNCKKLMDVNLVELQGKECFFFVPIKQTPVKRFLVCNSCGAAFELDEDLWHYYSSYSYRFDKSTTQEIVQTLQDIEKNLKENNVKLACEDKLSEASLNMIYKNLCEKYPNPQNVEELISVYFSKWYWQSKAINWCWLSVRKRLKRHHTTNLKIQNKKSIKSYWFFFVNLL